MPYIWKSGSDFKKGSSSQGGSFNKTSDKSTIKYVDISHWTNSRISRRVFSFFYLTMWFLFAVYFYHIFSASLPHHLSRLREQYILRIYDIWRHFFNPILITYGWNHLPLMVTDVMTLVCFLKPTPPNTEKNQTTSEEQHSLAGWSWNLRLSGLVFSGLFEICLWQWCRKTILSVKFTML